VLRRSSVHLESNKPARNVALGGRDRNELLKIEGMRIEDRKNGMCTVLDKISPHLEVDRFGLKE